MTQQHGPIRPEISKKNGTAELQNHLDMLRRRHIRTPYVTMPDGSFSQTGDLMMKEELSITLLTYFDIFRRRWWIVVLLSIIVGAMVYQWRRFQPKKYSATTVVEVVTRSPRVFTNIRDVVSYHFQIRRYYATQRVVLNSNTIAQKTLTSVPWVLQSPGFFGLDRVKDPVKRKQMMDKLRPRAFEILKAKTRIEAIRKSSLFRIHVQDTDPHRASELSLALAEAYREYNRLFRLRATINAYTKIKAQRQKFEQDYKKLQQALVLFRQQNDLLTTSLSNRRSLAFKRLDALNQQMVRVMLRRISLQSQLRPTRKKAIWGVKDSKVLFPPLLKNTLYWKLKERYSEILLKKESLITRYKRFHPLVQKQDQQLKRLRDIMMGQVNLIVSGYKQELRSARREERVLRGRVRLARKDLKRVDKLNLKFEQMKQKEKELKRSLKFLNKRFFEIQLLKDSTATNVRIVDRARPPKSPFSPRPVRDSLVGSVFGFVFFLALFVFVEMMDRSIRSLEDIQRKSGITPLGDFPLLNRKKNQEDLDLLYNPERPLSIVEESVRAIRTNLMFMATSNKGLHKILMTSPLPKEGKTFMAINLAIGIAHAGRKTIIVDTDMRRPRVHKVLKPDFDRSKGASSVIIGQHTLDEAMIKTHYPNLWVLPCGPIPPSPTELLQTEGFFLMMEELMDRFDMVLFDSPPIVQISDAAVLSSYMDGVILVSSCGSTNFSALQVSSRKIESVGGRVLGCILNKFSSKNRRAYYGYNSYYTPYRYKHYGYTDSEDL